MCLLDVEENVDVDRWAPWKWKVSCFQSVVGCVGCMDGVAAEWLCFCRRRERRERSHSCEEKRVAKILQSAECDCFEVRGFGQNLPRFQ